MSNDISEIIAAREAAQPNIPDKGWMDNTSEAYTTPFEPGTYKNITPEVVEHGEDGVLKTLGNVAQTIGKAGLSVGPVSLMNLKDRIIRGRLEGNVDEERVGPIPVGEIPIVMDAWKWCFNSYRPGVQRDIGGWHYLWMQFNGENAGFIARRNPSKNKNNDWEYVFAFRGTQSVADTWDDISSTAYVTINNFLNKPLPIPVEGAYAPGLRIDELFNRARSSTRFVRDWIPFGIGHSILRGEDVGARDTVASFMSTFREQVAKQQVKKILVTGHSLGGGSAEVFACCLIQILPHFMINTNRFRCVTFEAMRGLRQNTLRNLLKTRAGDFLDNSTIRIINDKDPVPSVPPISAGFAHLGRYAWFLTGAITEGILRPRGGRSGVGMLDLKTAFDTNIGPHSMKPTSNILQRMREYSNQPNFSEMAYLQSGRGKIMRKKRAKKTMTAKEKAMMKAKMAYVRSFKKK